MASSPAIRSTAALVAMCFAAALSGLAPLRAERCNGHCAPDCPMHRAPALGCHHAAGASIADHAHCHSGAGAGIARDGCHHAVQYHTSVVRLLPALRPPTQARR